MEEDLNQIGGNSNYNGEGGDTESNTLNQPLVKANRTLSSTPLALVGAKVSYIESLDYEYVSSYSFSSLHNFAFRVSLYMFLIFNLTIDRINENDLFKHDWRKRSKAQVLQYVFLKWTLACLVGLFTGLIATLINLAVENIAGYKLLAVGHFLTQERLKINKASSNELKHSGSKSFYYPFFCVMMDDNVLWGKQICYRSDGACWGKFGSDFGGVCALCVLCSHGCWTWDS